MTVRLATNNTPAEPAAVRARRLMAEARSAAREQVLELEEALSRVTSLAAEVAEGGEAYPSGIRDACERLVVEVVARAQQISAITRNVSRPALPL